ncbi:energy-coupling factor transporter transmembrane component T family protein [Kurthia huakuii]|uniref:energy-coupling factor transporter transmembrane component T family protein n=1 Tax=Kurthia huakuii TaxID=1421019 RepID=UPI000495BEB5|nr:energy-coupling factor transporter transmembrane protein EcfT [Kurthia huakuii]MBM7700827.1 energy-coupling factor transport system permease protein [Kurthia huakuii]
MESAINYVAHNSLLHRLDPRTKIIGLAIFLLGFVQIERWGQLAIAACVVLALCSLAHISLPYLWRTLKPLLLILSLTVLYHSIFSGVTHIAGFVIGLHYGAKILLMIISGVLLTATTKPMDLALGLETMLRPLEKWRVPIGQWALMIVLALRFFPLILEESERIRLSQQARGIIPKTLRERIYWPAKLIIPLLLSLITRAERLSIAIEARGFQRGFHRTHFQQLTFHKRDGYSILFPIFVSIIVLLT